MANFDLDDPLGDLLSDGSDDSFFNDPKPKKTKSPEKKSSVKDLFGLEEKQPEPKKDDWLGLDAKKKQPEAAPRRGEKTAKKISFEENDDILNTLGLDNKKTESKKPEQSKKSSLMASILGPQKEDDKKFLSLDDLIKDSKLKKSEVPEVSQSTSQLPVKADASSFGLSSLDAPREGRRGRPKTPAISDPLGLFSTETSKPPERPPSGRLTAPIPKKEETKEIETEVLFAPKETKSKASSSDVPDWLSGTESKSIDQIPSRKNSLTKTELPQEQSTQNFGLDSVLTQQKLATSNLGYQNATLALQQQESQVLMALQMKKYEESLAEIQRKQSDVLIKQEQQFNSLLDRQFAKQQIMENNMRLQHERINNHIQLLLSQPPLAGAVSVEEIDGISEVKKSAYEECSKQFEDIITNLKQRQHEEMFLLEESYKKQISTIEQSMESVENHLKMELDAMMQKHKEKLENLDAEHQDEVQKYKKKIEELHSRHENEMKQMRENNDRVLEEIKYEYNTIIENIKTSKQNDHAVLQNAGNYSEKLDANLKMLDLSSRSLVDIKEKVEKDFGVMSMAREEAFKAKQEEINLMRAALEKAREAADTERAELMGLVRNLELKLSEQSHNAREERFALQQATSALIARASAIEREAEFNRNSLEREREQLNTLRETLLAEQEKAIKQITEEKLALHAEKVRLETSVKLNQNYDTQRAKAEMETAIQVAKEAAELTDRERENLLRQLREVETLKRNLNDRERKLLNRERDLEVAMEEANRKHLTSEKAMDDARIMQMNYNDRFREIQAQMNSLTLRERKLAEEKIAISKERLALHNATRQMRKCGLCAVDNVPRLEEDENSRSEPVEQDIPRVISDADMFRLQLQMSEDQLTTHDDRYSNP